MLRLFFYRNSPLVKISFWMALISMTVFFFLHSFESFSLACKIGYVFFLGQIGFAKFLSLYPWYSSQALGPGICLQFEKALVPVSYISLIQSGFMWMGFSSVGVFLFNLLLLPITAVGWIMIYFHRVDPNASNPNFLSGLKSFQAHYPSPAPSRDKP